MKTILILGDAFILLTFSLVGLLSHEQGITLMGLLRNSGLLLLVWFALAPVTRIYGNPKFHTLILHWLVAITAGVWLRQIVIGHPFNSVFWLITMCFTGALLLAFRAAFTFYRHATRQKV